MKKTFLIGGLIMFIFGLHTIIERGYPVEGFSAEKIKALNNKNSTNEHPTKEEWLEVYLTHEIKQSIEMYRRRVAVVISIRTKEREIIITLTSASGQVEGLKEMAPGVRRRAHGLK